MNTFILTDYKVISTRVDDGQKSISAIINYKGSAGAIIVILKTPLYEEMQIEKAVINVTGHLATKASIYHLLLYIYPPNFSPSPKE